MADKTKNVEKPTSSKTKYKAANPSYYKDSFVKTSPEYDALCKGESVEVDVTHKFFKRLIEGKILIKE